MEKYLQNLVIILPATSIAMGGLLLVVFIYSRSRSKSSESNILIPQRSVTTQVDQFLQVNCEIRNKLIEEAMEIVKSNLSEEFRKKQASNISQEEFNNLYRKQRGLDSGDMDVKKMESVFRIPGVASLACAPKPLDSTSLKRSNSFATLWTEELQNSEDGDTVLNNQIENRHCITTQLGLSEAKDMNEVKLPNELQQELDIYLLTASSNLRQSMTLSMAQNLREAITLNSNAELSMMPGCDYLEHSAENFALVASTSTSMNVPQLLKGGAPLGEFEWRLDIEEKDVEDSPPNTPVRHRPPSHLCRGVRFMYEDHPPALSIIDLDPELGYGWRGPDWKENYGKYHIYKEHIGPSLYRKPKMLLASNPGVVAHYRSVRVEAKRKWDTIKIRYREAREKAFLRAKLHADIHELAEWRKQSRTLYSDSSSLSESDHVPEQHEAGQQAETELDEANQIQDPNRIKSMLTSSSSSPNSDESSQRVHPLTNNPKCKMQHRHCKALTKADQESSRSSTSNE